MPVSQGGVTLTASGSQPNRLANAVASRSFALGASPDNSETIYIGPAGVTAATGFPLTPGSTVSIDGGGLDDLWVVGTQGDQVSWLASA
jgi:hypothetical protein